MQKGRLSLSKFSTPAVSSPAAGVASLVSHLELDDSSAGFADVGSTASQLLTSASTQRLRAAAAVVPQLVSIDEPSFTNSQYSLAFCHLLSIHQRAQNPILDSINKASLLFTCLRAALLTRYSYSSIMELCFLLASPDPSLLALHWRQALSRSSGLGAVRVEWRGRPSPQSMVDCPSVDAVARDCDDCSIVYFDLPAWVRAPEVYRATVLRYMLWCHANCLYVCVNSSVLEILYQLSPFVFPCRFDGALFDSSTQWLFPVPSITYDTELLKSAAEKYALALLWARRAAHHPEVGAELFEVFIPLLVDLIHSESCCNNTSPTAQTACATFFPHVAANTDADSGAASPTWCPCRAPSVGLPCTSCPCVLHPLLISAESLISSSASVLSCNISECWRVVLHFLFANGVSLPSPAPVRAQDPLPTSADAAMAQVPPAAAFSSFSVIASFTEDVRNLTPSAVLLFGRDQYPHQLANLVTHGLRSCQNAFVNTVHHPLSLFSGLPLKLASASSSSLSDASVFALTPSVISSFASGTLSPWLRLPSVTPPPLTFLPPLAMGYPVGIQRFCAGFEFDICAAFAPLSHGCTSIPPLAALQRTTSSEYFLRQLLDLAPIALISGSPIALDLLHRLGWTLLADDRWCWLGFQVAPVLAVRCLLISAILRPSAIAAWLVADLLHQQVLPLTPELELTLRHDVNLLRLVCMAPVAVDNRLEECWSTLMSPMGVDSSTATALQDGIRIILISICFELQKLITFLELKKRTTTCSTEIDLPPFSRPEYPNYDEKTIVRLFPIALCLTDYAERVALGRGGRDVSSDRLWKIRELQVLPDCFWTR
jgi:hypothetical protein